MSKIISHRIDELHNFETDHVWIEENMAKILEHYNEQWIAVKNRQIFASDVDLNGLLSNLPDSAHTCVEYITREPLEMVL
jgi:NADPH-dependent 7-cyano-7-deazaguanine reductase QueF